MNTIHHLNLKLLIFIGILQVLRYEFQKFRILVQVNLAISKSKGIGENTLSYPKFDISKM